MKFEYYKNKRPVGRDVFYAGIKRAQDEEVMLDERFVEAVNQGIINGRHSEPIPLRNFSFLKLLSRQNTKEYKERNLLYRHGSDPYIFYQIRLIKGDYDDTL